MAPTPYLTRLPYVRRVLGALDSVVGRSRLMRIEEEGELTSHIDTNYYWRDHLRVHLPVRTTPDVQFECAGEQVHMAAGEAWVFDTWRPHRVVNPSHAPRIHLVVDTVGGPNLWHRIDHPDAPVVDVVVDGPEPSLVTERVNRPVVMSPWELEHALDLLLAELDASAPTVAAALDEPVLQLERAWRSAWARFGDGADGREHFAAFRDRGDAVIAAIAGDVRLPNGVVAIEAIRQHALASRSIPIPTPIPARRPRSRRPFGRRHRVYRGSTGPSSWCRRRGRAARCCSRRWRAPVGCSRSAARATGSSSRSRGCTRRPRLVVEPPDASDATAPSPTASVAGSPSSCATATGTRPGPAPCACWRRRRRTRCGFRSSPPCSPTPASSICTATRARPSAACSTPGSQAGSSPTRPPRLGRTAVVAAARPRMAGPVDRPLAEIVTAQWSTATEVLLDDLEQLDPDRWCVTSYDASSATRRARWSVSPRSATSSGTSTSTPSSRSRATPSTLPDPDKWRRNADELDPHFDRVRRSRCRAHGVFAPSAASRRWRAAPRRAAAGTPAPARPARSPPGSRRSAACTPPSFPEVLAAAGVLAARLDVPERAADHRARTDGAGSTRTSASFECRWAWRRARRARDRHQDPGAASSRTSPRGRASSSRPASHDACFVPRSCHVTGDIRVHDMACAGDELWAVNTRFSCLCTLDPDYSFVPRWRPPFVTALAAEDRCHLNGLAIVDDRAPLRHGPGRDRHRRGLARATSRRAGSCSTSRRARSSPAACRCRTRRAGTTAGCGCWSRAPARSARSTSTPGGSRRWPRCPASPAGCRSPDRIAFVGLSQVRETRLRGHPADRRRGSNAPAGSGSSTSGPAPWRGSCASRATCGAVRGARPPRDPLPGDRRARRRRARRLVRPPGRRPGGRPRRGINLTVVLSTLGNVSSHPEVGPCRSTPTS